MSSDDAVACAREWLADRYRKGSRSRRHSGDLARLDRPRPNLNEYGRRLRTAGVQEVKAVHDAAGRHLEVVGGVAARGQPVAIVGYGHSVWIATEVHWTASAAPITDALDELAVSLERFDRIARLKRAAVDMELVEHAAEGLIEARENRGEARYFERVIETGMVVTYARAFAGTNRAGLDDADAPIDQHDRELHADPLDEFFDISTWLTATLAPSSCC